MLNPDEISRLGGGGHIPDLDVLGASRELHEPQPMASSALGGIGAGTDGGGQIDVSALTNSILSAMQQQQQNRPPG